MLIRFKVSNFLSFKEETEFSMVAGSERIHPNHIIQDNKKHPKLLRAALLYGANAAGKSNFVKAIFFAKELVTDNRYTLFNDLSVNSFRLDTDFDNKPSRFEFEFLSKSRIFNYVFESSSRGIVYEKLCDLTTANKILFERKVDNTTGKSIFAPINFLESANEKQFLEFVQRSTIAGKLFLLHCQENNVEFFSDAFVWFTNSLNIIFPTTIDWEIESKLNEDSEFFNYFSNILLKAGTGISKIAITNVPIKKPVVFGANLQPLFPDDMDYFITKDELRLDLIHSNKTFQKDEESDGTRRLFDLAFPFYDLATSETPKVYIIDELERNLHTNLSYMLLKSYLEQSGKGQLIATTHDTHLLDLDLLRRDEIWFAEKDEHGATQLYSLYDFNPRYDKKIEKEYLTGRFGAIPFLGNIEFKKQLAKNGKSKK